MATKTSFNFLNRLRLWQKFLLLGIFVAIAVLLPYVQTLRTSQESIDFAQKKLSGLASADAMVKVIQLTQQHRGLSASVLGGVVADANARAVKEKEVNVALASVDAVIAGDERAALRKRFAALKQEWKALADSTTTNTTDIRKNFDAHVTVIGNMLLFLELVADDFKLSLDPNANTYFLIQAATVHLTASTEYVGQGRAFGIGLLGEAKRLRDAGTDSAAAVTAADREKLSGVLTAIRSTTDNAYRFLDKAGATDPNIKTKVDVAAAAPKRAAVQMYDLAKKEITDTASPSFDPVEYRRIFTEGLDTQFKFYAVISELTAHTLNQQIDDLRSKRFTATVLI